jgi:hypothetical protein
MSGFEVEKESSFLPPARGKHKRGMGGTEQQKSTLLASRWVITPLGLLLGEELGTHKKTGSV